MEITQRELLEVLKNLKREPHMDVFDCLNRDLPSAPSFVLLKEQRKTVAQWYKQAVEAWPPLPAHNNWLFPVDQGAPSYFQHREHGTMWVGVMGEQHEALLAHLIQTLENEIGASQ